MLKRTSVVIPAGATLELDDNIYLQAEKQLAPLIKAGKLVILKGVQKSDEQIAKEEAEALEAARKLIAEADAKAKAKKDTGKKTEG